jgi:hypothetical protein
VLADGRFSTVLSLLGTTLYPDINENDWVVFWKDADWEHESWDNIDITPRQKSHLKRRMSSLGVPSGTPEYHRRYREANKETVKQWNKRAAKKHREKVRVAIAEERRAADAVAEAEPVDMIAEIMATAGMTGEPE